MLLNHATVKLNLITRKCVYDPTHNTSFILFLLRWVLKISAYFTQVVYVDQLNSKLHFSTFSLTYKVFLKTFSSFYGQKIFSWVSTIWFISRISFTISLFMVLFSFIDLLEWNFNYCENARLTVLNTVTYHKYRFINNFQKDIMFLYVGSNSLFIEYAIIVFIVIK